MVVAASLSPRTLAASGRTPAATVPNPDKGEYPMRSSSPFRRSVPATSATAGAFGLLSRMLVVLFATTLSLAPPVTVLAQQSAQTGKPAIVLVHGAFADGS